MTIRIAALASGRGSNLQAVLDAIAVGSLDARIVGVFSDKPAAPALQRVPEALRWSRKPKRYASREDFDAALAQRMSDRAVKLIRATEAGELLPRSFSEPTHFECRMCQWQDRCWRTSR